MKFWPYLEIIRINAKIVVEKENCLVLYLCFNKSRANKRRLSFHEHSICSGRHDWPEKHDESALCLCKQFDVEVSADNRQREYFRCFRLINSENQTNAADGYTRDWSNRLINKHFSFVYSSVSVRFVSNRYKVLYIVDILSIQIANAKTIGNASESLPDKLWVSRELRRKTAKYSQIESIL